MEPWQSWTIALVLGGGLFYYYKPAGNIARGRVGRAHAGLEQPLQSLSTRRRQDRQTPPRGNETSNSAGRSVESLASVGEISINTSNTTKQPKKRKVDKAPSSQPTASLVALAEEDLDDAQQEIDDSEWVKQLEARKKGVSLTVAPRRDNSATKKQNIVKKQNGIVASPGNSTLRTGPINSNLGDIPAPAPMPSTSVTNGAASGRDVSDMLETPTAGPSIIRITGEQKAKKFHEPHEAPPQESKKQRQNRKKVEDKKMAREEGERERKVLEEKQRRTARESRSEPAKNGLGVAMAPSNNAWSAAVPTAKTLVTNGSGTSRPTSYLQDTQLLDTFDHDGVSTTSSNEPTTNTTSPETAPSTLDQDHPSEETQIQMLNEMNGDAGWNEVTIKGKKGKRKTQAPDILAESSGKETNLHGTASASDLMNGGLKTTTSAPKKNSAFNGYAALELATGYTSGTKGHPEDSDWAVS